MRTHRSRQARKESTSGKARAATLYEVFHSLNTVLRCVLPGRGSRSALLDIGAKLPIYMERDVIVVIGTGQELTLFCYIRTRKSDVRSRKSYEVEFVSFYHGTSGLP